MKPQLRYIIVDEISMITKDLWKRLCLLKQETDITFLQLGDESSVLRLRTKRLTTTLTTLQSSISVITIRMCLMCVSFLTRSETSLSESQGERGRGGEI
jgi:hypothetical protein